MYKLLAVLLCSLLLIPRIAHAQDQVATYSVTFDATWSQQTHPHPDGADHFPTNAHWSPLVGGAHNDRVAFWAVGVLASPGIERMAEQGATQPLLSEIAATGGNFYTTLVGPGIGHTPGSALISRLTITQDYPLVTLVSMIAPSPDWFTGVAGLSLLDANGQWYDHLAVAVYPYDAGSDDGADYAAADQEPTAHHLIANYSGVAPFANQPVGKFVFTRIHPLYLPVVAAVQ
jgi:hypothetical protein